MRTQSFRIGDDEQAEHSTPAEWPGKVTRTSRIPPRAPAAAHAEAAATVAVQRKAAAPGLAGDHPIWGLLTGTGDYAHADEIIASADPAVQRDVGGGGGSPARVHDAARAGVSGPGGALPHLDPIQHAFGHHDVGGVRAHVGGAAADASHAIGARAYATGDDVAFASSPDLHTAAHEAAHVVQQRGGVRLAGGVGQAGDPYEQHADAVADLVVRGASAEALLDTMAHRGAGGGPAVQRWAELGWEYYRGNSSEAGAGTPDGGVSGSENEFPVQVFAGSIAADGQLPGEDEWRRLLNGGGFEVECKLYGFLRAALLDDAAWEAHVLSHYQSIPEGLGWNEAGVAITNARRHIRRPTSDEQRALAKALFLRGSSEMGTDFHRDGINELMSSFIATWQPQIIAHMADSGYSGGVDMARPMARATTSEQQMIMLGSAFGSIIEGAMHYSIGVHVPPGTGRDYCMSRGTRMVREASYLVRGLVGEVEAIRDEQRELLRTAFEVAMAAIPLPSLSELLLPAASVAEHAAAEAVAGGTERAVERGAEHAAERAAEHTAERAAEHTAEHTAEHAAEHTAEHPAEHAAEHAATGALDEATRGAIADGIDKAHEHLRNTHVRDAIVHGLMLPSLSGRMQQMRTEAVTEIESWELGEHEPTLIAVLDSAIM